MKPMKFFWGLVIIGIGVLILGTNFGWWNPDIWTAIWLVWPLILIVIGFRFLINNDKWFMLIALLLVVLAGYTIIEKPAVVLDKLDRNIEVFSEKISDTYDSSQVKNLNFKLDTGASKITFGSLDNETSKSNLYQVETKNYGKLDKKLTILGENAEVKIEEEVGHQWLGQKLSERELVAKLTSILPVRLDINSGASKFDFDFRDIHLTRLNLNSGASKGEITLGDKEKGVEVNIEAGASKLSFNIPKNVGLKVNFTSEQGLNSKDFDSKLELVEENHVYTSKNFETTEKKIEINLSTGVSDVELNQY